MRVGCPASLLCCLGGEIRSMFICHQYHARTFNTDEFTYHQRRSGRKFVLIHQTFLCHVVMKKRGERRFGFAHAVSNAIIRFIQLIENLRPIHMEFRIYFSLNAIKHLISIFQLIFRSNLVIHGGHLQQCSDHVKKIGLESGKNCNSYSRGTLPLIYFIPFFFFVFAAGFTCICGYIYVSPIWPSYIFN